MNRNIQLIILLSLLLPLKSKVCFSQENQKISPSIQLQYFKDNDEKSYLKSTLTYSKNRMEMPVTGVKIIFISGKERKLRLAEITTDDKGVAVYYLDNKADLSADKNGLWSFRTEFTGNDTIEPCSSDQSIREVHLTMDLTIIDSIKTIKLNAKKIEKGNPVPVSGEKVTLYVPRMFSLLPIGEATLDDSGSSSVEFPATLPGDKEGNITIIARFEDNPEFGNIEKRTSLKWGLPSSYSIHPGHRALWTKTAPKWMIYTLSVLLSGVWGHYLFAFISLIRIKHEAKKKARQEYRV
jgi:hypothetical protein